MDLSELVDQTPTHNSSVVLWGGLNVERSCVSAATVVRRPWWNRCAVRAKERVMRLRRSSSPWKSGTRDR